MLNPCWGKLVQEGMFLSDEIMDMIFYCDKIPKSDRCKIYHSSYCLCVGMWRRDGEEDDGGKQALLDTGSALLYS